jgi:hypothetical protein
MALLDTLRAWRSPWTGFGAPKPADVVELDGPVQTDWLPEV